MYVGKYDILGSTTIVKKPQKYLASFHQKCSSIMFGDFGTKTFEQNLILESGYLVSQILCSLSEFAI